jgi:hypothetical protein
MTHRLVSVGFVLDGAALIKFLFRVNRFSPFRELIKGKADPLRN